MTNKIFKLFALSALIVMVQGATAKTLAPCSQVPNRTSAGRAQCALIDSSFYRGLLGRVPDQAGLNFWVQHSMAGTVSCAQIAEFFINTDDFKRRYSSTDILSGANILYRALLGRSLAYDNQAISYIANNRPQLSSLAKSILTSAEFSNRCRVYGFSR